MNHHAQLWAIFFEGLLCSETPISQILVPGAEAMPLNINKDTSFSSYLKIVKYFPLGIY
jgi:hypothetical protein